MIQVKQSKEEAELLMQAVLREAFLEGKEKVNYGEDNGRGGDGEPDYKGRGLLITKPIAPQSTIFSF